MPVSGLTMRMFLLALSLLATPVFAQSEATYSVTFESTWTSSSHPDGFPPGPHFSGLVGATHRPSVVLWEPGAKASQGIEVMAETGAKSILLAEAEALQGSGSVESTLSGSGIPSPGSTSLTFTVSESHAFVSLVAMLAPSPDWFVGVSGLALRDGDGWISEIVVPLDVYDAGTDSGSTYTADDDDTAPADDIARIEESPFKVGDALVPVGTYTFALQRVTDAEVGPQALELAEIAPNPVRSAATLAITRSAASPITVEVFDALGRLVSTPVAPQGAGRQIVRIETIGWAPGVYHARVTARSQSATRRFVVQ